MVVHSSYHYSNILKCIILPQTGIKTALKVTLDEQSDGLNVHSYFNNHSKQVVPRRDIMQNVWLYN